MTREDILKKHIDNTEQLKEVVKDIENKYLHIGVPSEPLVA